MSETVLTDLVATTPHRTYSPPRKERDTPSTFHSSAYSALTFILPHTIELVHERSHINLNELSPYRREVYDLSNGLLADVLTHGFFASGLALTLYAITTYYSP